MAKSQFSNVILARLSQEYLDSIRPHLRAIDLEVKQAIYQPNRPIQHVYFVETGMISIVSIMQDGSSIEVGTIGKEGMAGTCLLFGMNSVPTQYFVQIVGRGHRMEAEKLKDEAERNREFRDLILKYQAVFHTQTMQIVACNGLHSVQQRCCRWLLMSHDRVQSNMVALTHEFLAIMLGVRRASVSEVLHPLQDWGWIQSKRGEITILDRQGLESGSCECYQVIAQQQKQFLN